MKTVLTSQPPECVWDPRCSQTNFENYCPPESLARAHRQVPEHSQQLCHNCKHMATARVLLRTATQQSIMANAHHQTLHKVKWSRLLQPYPSPQVNLQHTIGRESSEPQGEGGWSQPHTVRTRGKWAADGRDAPAGKNKPISFSL